MAARIVRDSDDSADDLSDCATSIDPLQDGSPDRLTSSVKHPEPRNIYPTPSVSNDRNNHTPSKNNLKRSRTIHGLEDLHTTQNNDGKSLKRRKTATPGITTSRRHDNGLIENERERDIFEFDDVEQHTSKPDHRLTRVSNEIDEDELSREEHLHAENGDSFDNSTFEDANTWASESAVHPEPAPLYGNYETVGLSNRTPIRSKSMQIPIDSPHDTEIMSSRSLARARRALTMGSQLPQSSACSVDELALPVSIEVAVPPPAPDAMNASFTPEPRKPRDPISNDYESDDFGGMPKEMYVPRSTRSRQVRSREEPSNDDGNVPRVVIDVQDEEEERLPSPVHVIDENEAYQASHSTPIQHEHPRQEIPHDDVQQQNHHPKSSENTDPIDIPQKPKRARKNTKKKLKRGKTASVLVRKTVESDVEDDVIWVEERPLAPTSDNLTTKSNQQPPIYQNDEENLGETPKVEANINQESPTQTNTIHAKKPPPVETEPPAPKKRGRKRKKTTDVTEPAAPPKTPQPVQSPVPEPAEIDADEKTPPQLSDEPDITHIGTEYGVDRPDKPDEDEKKKQPEPAENPPQSPATRNTIEQHQVETPKKEKSVNDSTGPTKHSPIAITNKAGFRVGLSRKARIAPLLKIVRK